MIRRLIKIVIGLSVLGLAGYALLPLWAYWQARHKPQYRQVAVTRGEIVSVVNSTGTVQPVITVQVGAFVSGPVQSVKVDFNDRVKKDQVLAKIDPMIINAQFEQAKASLECADANLLQADAKVEQANQDWKRAQKLLPQKAIADTDYDLAKANYDSAVGNVALCKATIAQNKAALDLAKANVNYTNITSPVDGVILDRKVDPGQTVASSFQTPELFKVAPEMEKRIFIMASVDEADIGLIREAQQRREPVMFTVDAYPNDLFRGKVHQVRFNSSITQNVVTYPVVVECPNPELKLLPGMTASISFQIAKHVAVLRVPNAALRFYPKPEQVRPEDRPLLEGEEQPPANSGEARATDPQRSAMEKAEAGRKRQRRHVWIVEGDFLRAVEVLVGLSDSQNSEVVSGALTEGQEVVTGMAPPKL
jgi:HlyD family secretion protein